MIPEFIKRGIVNRWKQSWIVEQKFLEGKLPLEMQLQAIHLANAKLLPNRIELLKCLPQNAVVAELGVDTGNFSEAILQFCKPQKLHLVDAWDTIRYGEDKAQRVTEKFKEAIEQKHIQIHRGYSTIKVRDFADEYFDWIYIDTDHSFTTTKEELKLYSSKVKPGGIIAGHDFIKGNWLNGYRYGVIEAVQEFCVINNWELIFLTTETNDHPSFAIKRISKG